MNIPSYGKLLRLTEGHGTSEIYQQFLALLEEQGKRGEVMDLTDDGLRERLASIVTTEPDGKAWRVVFACGAQRSSVIRRSEQEACEAYAAWIREKILLPEFLALRDEVHAELAIPCQRHGCMWDAPEAHEACRAAQSVILEASTAWLEESLRAEERGRAEQRELLVEAIRLIEDDWLGTVPDSEGNEWLAKARDAVRVGDRSQP